MDRIFAITMAYCDPVMLAHGSANFIKTAGSEIERHLILDNCWPLAKNNHFENILSIAKMTDAHVFKAEENLGGTKGFNRLVELADVNGCEEDDFILYLDPDQTVITDNWLTAMLEVMKADKKISVLCLWPYQQMRTNWNDKIIAGHKIRTYTSADMYSGSLWRRSFIGKGIEGWYKYYGQIEIPAFEKASKMGMYPAYLADFKEGPCPISHDKRYTKWKAEHVSNSFLGDFSQWLEEKK